VSDQLVPAASHLADRTPWTIRLGQLGYRFLLVMVAGIILAILGVMLAVVIGGNRTDSLETFPGPIWPYLGVVVVLTAATVSGLRVVWRRWLPKVWMVGTAIGLGAFGSKLTAALAIKSVPYTDFLTQLEAAQLIAKGDWSFNQSWYFQIWGYQTPFSVYQATVLRLAGPSITSLLVLNAVFMAVTNVMVFVLAHRLTKNPLVACAAALAYLVYPAPYLMASVLTNQHLATCLFFVGLLLFLRAVQDVSGWQRLTWAAGGGIAIGLGDLMRPIGVVALVTVAVTLGGAWLLNQVGWRGVVLVAGGLALVYGSVTEGADWAAKASGLNPAGLGNAFPEWKLAHGTDRMAYGGYSGKVRLRFTVDDDGTSPVSVPFTLVPDRQAARELIREQIKDALAHPTSFLARKIWVMWVRPEIVELAFKPYLAPDSPSYDNWRHRLDKVQLFERAVYSTILVFALASVVVAWRRRPDPTHLLTVAVLVAYFAAHLPVETQAHYRYFWMPPIFALSSLVLAQIVTWRNQLIPDRLESGPSG